MNKSAKSLKQESLDDLDKDNLIDQYKELNEKCDVVLEKISKRNKRKK